MSLLQCMKTTVEDMFIAADEYICRLVSEMTVGLSALILASVLWLCFG